MPCLRIAYAGTPEFSVPALQSLLTSEHEVVVVITQPDRRAGRGKKLSYSAVKLAALDADIPLLQPNNINDLGVVDELKQLNLDMIIVAAFGQIFSEEVLTLAKYGCINIHASLLPKWRGASPIQHAILEGDSQSGVTIMQMEKGMDAGDVWLQSTCPITDDDTSQSLHDCISELSGHALLKAIDVITKGEQNAKQQLTDQVTYCTKIQKNDGLIDWSNSAQRIIRQLKAYDPWPGIFTYINERRIRIVCATEETCNHDSREGMVLDVNANGILVSCGTNGLRIQEMIPAGGKRMHAIDFANSNEVLGIMLGQH